MHRQFSCFVWTASKACCPRKTSDAEFVMDFAFADCELRAQAGNICIATFDWRCSGICRSVERIMEVHQRCGEDESALWNKSF